MFKRPAQLMTMAALVLGALTACDGGPGPTDVSMPFTESFSAELEDDITTGVTGMMLVSTETDESGTEVIAIIGREGGTITAGGHTLEVPPNAVGAATKFTMEVMAGSAIVVDLKARGVDSGDPVRSFPNALTLSLSYDNVFRGADVKRLRNVYLQSPGNLVPLSSTLDKKNKTISSPIDHFSQYGMGIE